jgi:hypothetical protein
MAVGIILGSYVRDVITGFEGVAIARTRWLYGCSRIGVQQGVDSKGVVPDPIWVDEQRVSYVPGKMPAMLPIEPSPTPIKLSDRVRDRVSGYIGIVQGHTVYATGQQGFSVLSETLNEGKPVEFQYFNAEQLELLESFVHPAFVAPESPKDIPGGPQADPVAARGPK